VSHLTEAQSRDLFDKYGSYVKEICDACGRPLTSLRWTIHGDPRAWCSSECRVPFLPPEWRTTKTEKKKRSELADGVCHRKSCLDCGTQLDAERSSRDFCNDTCRKRFRRKERQKSRTA
jgi:hypothetical protein